MQRFTIHSAMRPSDNGLHAWIRERCRELRREYDVDFEFDFPREAQVATCCPMLINTLDSILTEAAASAQSGSTVDVGVYWTRRGLEIEVSTNSDLVESESMSAFRRETFSVGNGFSLSLYRARCPQGGTAWIIVQSHFARLRMIA